MTVFWILAGLTAALGGLLVLAGARRGADDRADEGAGLAARELAELDRLRARDLLDADAWTLARAEAGRRWLNTPTAGARPIVVRGRDRVTVLATLGGSVLAALLLYLSIGTPGLADQPYERRVDQWAGELATLDAPQIAAVAARVVRERPGDHEALVMLGAARFEAGDPIGAVSAFRRALALKPDDAQSWARLGESLVRSQDGVIGADAEAAFREALKRDPDQLGARYFLGDAALGRNDRKAAGALWGPLIAVLDPADPRRVDLERRLASAARSESR